MLKTYFAVMLGGALGTAMRMALSGWLAAKFGETFPVGTILVNVSGCFIIGIFAALAGPGGIFSTSPLTQQVVMIGVLGGYTTFSSFGLQTFYFLQRGEWFRGAMNAGLSLVLCVLAVWLGHIVAMLFNQRA